VFQHLLTYLLTYLLKFNGHIVLSRVAGLLCTSDLDKTTRLVYNGIVIRYAVLMSCKHGRILTG